jgi:2-polyprenyl-6-methoxyphenol hydroxylase-like FAD-dependent oxidoreductase
MEVKYDAIVIGLGPVGSFMALKLEKYGLKVLAIDKEKDIYPLPRAVSISDQGMRMHQSLDLENIYYKNSDAPGGAGFVDENLEFIGEPMTMKGLNTPNGWPPMRFFHQPYTDREIRNKLLNSSCDILVEHELLDINDSSESSCSIKNLNTNETIDYEFKYLIGADGANSKVRELKNIKQEDLNYDRDWIIIDIELLTEKGLGEFAIQICDPKRIGTFIPTHSPFKRWEFEIHDDDNVEEFSSDENINKLLLPWLEPKEYKILRKAIYQFHSVLAEEFQKDNCFLIGDSAHQNPPFMGEGMMTGCRDAENLAWKINMDFKYKLPNLLENYQVERKEHARYIVENSLGIGLLMEAYAHTKNKDDVPAELVAKGYGSFIIPPLDEGIFYEGKSNPESMSGQLFPQPVKIDDGEVIERCDFLLGNFFAIVSRNDFVLSEDEKKFLSSINSKILILDSELVDSNMWMSTMVQEDKVYIVRPDKYIFGSTNENISLSNLIEDLKTRIGFNN